MGTKAKQNRINESGLGHYWQSADLNTREDIMYRDWLISLAMSRYRWVNLPETCDERYLEFTLVTQGAATIARPEEGLQAWVSTQSTSGAPNIYDNPTSWQSVGNNGWRFDVTPMNGVMIWDNQLRTPIIDKLAMYADRLAKMDRMIEINLMQLSMPYVFTGPQERQQDMIQLIKQAFGGEPAVLGLRGIEEINVNLLATPVDFIGDKLLDAKKRIWNEIYSFLGIESIDAKSERMIESEVLVSQDSVNLRALDGLKTRRAAAKELNDRFGLNIDVYWNEDFESDNFNLLNSIKNMGEVD